jgi:hypothetical protein
MLFNLITIEEALCYLILESLFCVPICVPISV